MDSARQPAMIRPVAGQRSSPRHFPKPKQHGKKVMVVVWWSAAGLIHHSLMDPGESVTAKKYCQEIDEMHRKLQLTSPALVNGKEPVLLYDNARPDIIQLTLMELGYGTLSHPLNSPKLAPADYHLFKYLDGREKCFKPQHDAAAAFSDFIASRSPDFYVNGINKLVGRWQKCVDSNGAILIDEDLFELRYGYLKYEAQKRMNSLHDLVRVTNSSTQKNSASSLP